MNEYDKIMELTTSPVVELGASFKDLLHKKLVLGNTRYMCRYGTLGDGHEKITPSQRYFQSIKEMYYICLSIKDHKAVAMLAKADLLDAEEFLSKATKESEVLRAKAAIMRAESQLIGALVTIEDQTRQVDEHNKVRLELEDEVESQYPEGIEQAEPDNWEAIFRYRMSKSRTPGMPPEQISNIVLDPVRKAQLGYIYGRFDAIAALEIGHPKACEQVAENFEKHYLSLQEKERS